MCRIGWTSRLSDLPTQGCIVTQVYTTETIETYWLGLICEEKLTKGE